MNEVSDWFKVLRDVGVSDDLPSIQIRRIRLTNGTSLFLSIVSLLYFGGELTSSRYQPDTLWSMVWFYSLHIAAFSIAGIALILNYYHQYVLARIIIIIVFLISVLPGAWFDARPLQAEQYMFPLAAFIFALFNSRAILTILFLVPVCCFVALIYNVSVHNSYPFGFDVFMLVRILIAFASLYLIMDIFKYEVQRHETEIEQKNNELAERQKQLVLASTAKDKIIATISHDLRSPISSLSSVLSMMDHGVISQEEFKILSEQLKSEVDQLSTNLNELLQWSVTQTTELKPDIKLIRINTLIYSAYNQIKTRASEKSIDVSFSEDGDYTLRADPTMINSILLNLLSNAVKFTPGGGTILTRVQQNGANSVEIRIRNTGEGISDENKKKLFKKTVHFTTYGTDNEKGTGLGLILSMDYARLNGGIITVQSEPGKWTEFKLILPLTT